MGKIALVAVDKTAYSFDRLFSYKIPDRLSGKAVAGARVVVPFGRGNAKKQGLIFRVSDDVCCGELKEIDSVIDNTPVMTEDLLKTAEYLAANTFCTYYDAVHAILPNGFNYKIVPEYSLSVPVEDIDFASLSDDEKKVILILKTSSSPKKIPDEYRGTGKEALMAAAKSLEGKGILIKSENALRRISDKTVRMVKLSDSFDSDDIKLSPKQKSVVKLLEKAESASIKEVCYFCGVTDAVIKNLAAKGIITIFEREVLRTPVVSEKTGKKASDKLTAAQKKVYDGIWELCKQEEPAVALLRGVTGSGKTRIFLKLIKSVIESGKQAIMLVPEISLTPQTLKIFREMFGKNVAVMHSALSLGEQMDEWKRIKSGEAKIVVGTRSAVFAPFENIGLIIMDEEGEFSYKSDSTPRYHARDVAKLRAVHHKCLLLLASATPLVDSYYYAESGRYKLFTLENRFNSSSLPETEIVDLRQDKLSGTNAISQRLLEELAANLEKGEQSILLLNRRGYNTHAQCMDCGTVFTCPNCSVAMTYHKANGRLMCHYCGKSEHVPQKCPSCAGEHIRLYGIGTQKLEEEIRTLLPTARVLRMDTDTTYSKFAFEEKFKSFKQGAYDIMVGTQMIAKGHDFPNVTLTGVILADQTLYSGDFRCGEKTFSLLTQVVGRSGRGDKKGRAIIQTYSPENPVIAYAAKQDYVGFYRDEIEARKALLYPPFCDLCLLGISGADEERVIKASELLLKIIKDTAGHKAFSQPLKVLGPAQATVYRVNGKYRMRLILKCKMNSQTKKFIRFILSGISKLPEFSKVSVFADVNGEIG